MFSIGQHVIHPGQGVCTVVGFRDDTPQPMLLLETKQGHAQTILMYPVAQADRLHAAISQQDAEHLLSHYDELSATPLPSAIARSRRRTFTAVCRARPRRFCGKTMMHRIPRLRKQDKSPVLLHARTQGSQAPLHRGVRRALASPKRPPKPA